MCIMLGIRSPNAHVPVSNELVCVENSALHSAHWTAIDALNAQIWFCHIWENLTVHEFHLSLLIHQY